MVNAYELKHATCLEEWTQRVAECRGSGLSVKVWCEKNHWDTSTYYRWEREILGRARKKSPSTDLVIVSGETHLSNSGQNLVELPVTRVPPVQIEPKSVFSPAAVIRIGNMELELSNTVSPKLMKQLKELVRGA